MLFNKIDLKPCDGRDVELKGSARTAEYTIQKDSGDKRIVTTICSDESVDRDGDIIRVKGWKGLKEWSKNGAVLWAHNYSIQPVGVPQKAWVEKDKKRLMAEFSFPEEYGRAYPASEAVYQGIKAGAIACVSVGFSQMETRDPDDEERTELGLGQYGVVFEKQELYEISPCNVASNRNALIQQVKAAGIDTRSLEEMLQHEDNFVIELSSDDKIPGAEVLAQALDDRIMGDLKESFANYIDSMTDEEREAMKDINWEITTNHDGDTEIDWYFILKNDDDEPHYILSDDLDTMKITLEEAGYEVKKSDAGTDTLTVVMEPTVTVELDHQSEPPSDLPDEETINLLALQVSEAVKETISKRVMEKTRTAMKRVTDYHRGLVVED